MSPLRYLSFDRSEDADGVVTLEALAATPEHWDAAAWGKLPH